MPTTTARTPRPSANAAPMMNVARIWAAASGLRPIALVDMPVRMPMPMPGPMTPSAARPAPICSMGVGSSCLARWVTGSCGPDCMIAASRGFGEGRSGGDVLRGDVALGQVLGEPLVTLRMIVVVGLDGDEGEHEGQDAEDQRLHEIEQELEAHHGHRDDDERQARDDAEGDLAGVDVAEESHRERDRLDELEEELQQADEQGDDARPDAVAEPADVEELAEVAAEAQVPHALDVEHEERQQREPDRDVDVARRCPELFRPSDAGQQAAPVAQEDEQEEGDEDRHI